MEQLPKTLPIDRPLQNRVLVAVDEEDRVTDEGLYIPDNASRNGSGATGTVLAVGDGRKKSDGTRHPMEIEVGDRILFGENFGRELPTEGDEEYLLIRQTNVFAVLGE